MSGEDEGPGRDHLGEMRDLIDRACSGAEGYLPAAVAEKLVWDLRETDPGLLAGWLDRMAVQVVREMINRIDSSRRGAALYSRRHSAFRAAVVAHEGGAPDALQRLLDSPWLCADGARRPLGRMRRPDLLHASGAYLDRAVQNRALGLFLGVLARRVGDGRVEDHYSEEQVRAMFGSFTGSGAALPLPGS